MITRKPARSHVNDHLALAALVIAACAPASSALGQDDTLDWMTGHWRSTGGDPVIEEVWTDSAGGLLLGVNRTRVDGSAVGFEFLRIELAGETGRYCAQPGGRPASCFELVERGASSVRFENPDHDFPNVIAYSREGDVMTAVISDMSGEQAMSFAWTLVTG
ncbi:DUF6265 family protein [Maricaulis maris]|uniref:DUF6265 domain-containing protein n=1 Tax=Maricaulis maris TaxID=74318 RepID=A0A495D616_9PROT|nr:DUF6265 family protein [Maricaulis maris]RKQ96598.1 hypothetical protein C7435_1930 [Maricaulis maris]